MKIFLLESVRKKVLFLRYLLEKLDLQNSEVLNIRLENLGNQFINFFDIVLVRAVRMKNIYYKKCFELLRKNGEIIIYQSKNCHSRVNGFKKMYSNKYVRVITKYHPIKGIKHYIVIRND
jgi:16S rRNA (guanine527-N7)-methyltransferase